MGTIPERPMSSFPSYSSSGKEIDPLLKDLSERKQSFRKNVVSLAAELKEVRTCLALQEQFYAKETQTRQQAEEKVKGMEEEVSRLHKTLEEKNKQLQASVSSAEKYLRELDELGTELKVTKATADASATTAQLAQMDCLALAKDLDDKNSSIKQLEDRVKRLEEQLDKLQKDLQLKEASQKKLKEEVQRVERDLLETVGRARLSKEDLGLKNALDEVSPKNVEEMNRLLSQKDEEIAKLRDDIMVLSGHWMLKIQELEKQLEKHRTDHELKKRVLKLEFCLQESRSQTRKLQRMGERRDKEIKELKDQLATKQLSSSETHGKNYFWETSSFTILASVSMLVLVVFTRR